MVSVVIGAFLAAAAAMQPATASASPLPVYEIERSAVLSEAVGARTYAVMAAWPAGPPPKGGWPVLYVLDGDDNFALLTMTARRLARADQRSGVGEGLIVAIAAGPLADRIRDYTPPVKGYGIAPGQPGAGYRIGGGEAFLDDLATIKAAIGRRWPIDPARETLAGHSFGGLIALHAGLRRPALFDRIAAVSPSFWYGNGLLAREASVSAPTASLYIATGSDEAGADIAAKRFIAALPPAAQPRVRYAPLAGADHGSTMLYAAQDVLRLAFGKPRP